MDLKYLKLIRVPQQKNLFNYYKFKFVSQIISKLDCYIFSKIAKEKNTDKHQNKLAVDHI